MKLVCNYMKDEELRHKLNSLTRQTFYFDFENWVTGGYFEGDYIPYSFLEDERIVSNVSANKMCFMQNGRVKNYIQIGTVMTEPAYRKQGLAGKLLHYIIEKYEDECDGFYLFANLSALDFYREAGFQEIRQYRYTMDADNWQRLKMSVTMFCPIDPKDAVMKQKYMDAVKNSAVNAALDQMNRFGLQMFYTADLANMYYSEDLDCFVIMEKENDTLILKSVICKNHLSIKDILLRIQTDCHTLELGFAPCGEDADLFRTEQFDGGNDYRLFYKGEQLRSIETEKLFFPLFSHA